MRNILKKLVCSFLVISVICVNFISTNSYAEINNNIEITLGSKEVYLNEASKVSISFKESLNQSKITLVQECAGEQLLSELDYNKNTNSYEGIINYNIQPEAIDIWSIEKIIVGNKTINKKQLISMGLDLKSYEVKQKYYLHNIAGVNYKSRTKSSDKYSKYTVVLDAGHGGTSGSNWGGTTIINDKLWEKDYTIDTTLSTAQYLSNLGVNVILTRDKDVYVELQDRTSLINRKKPDFAVSIHYNGYSPKYNGTSTYYKYADRNGGTSKILASNITDSIINKFGFKREGIKNRTYIDSKTNKIVDYYHMIRESKVPTVLVECCYVTNRYDQAKVNTKEKRAIMGEEIGKGIIKTLNQINGEEEDSEEDTEEDNSNGSGGITEEITVKKGTATSNVNVRKGPSTNNASIGSLKKGTKVEVVGTDSKTGWYKIKYKSGYGYVSNKYIKIESSNSSSGGSNNGSTDGSTGGTTLKKGRATSNVNVRKGPSSSNASLGVLKKNTKVEVVGTDSKTGWYKIKYKSGYGYVSNKYIKIESSNSSSGGSNNGSTGGATVKRGTATANVNVRKGPSSSKGSLGVLKKNTKVEVVGKDNKTGWYKIKYKSTYGYVSNKYLTVK